MAIKGRRVTGEKSRWVSYNTLKLDQLQSPTESADCCRCRRVTRVCASLPARSGGRRRIAHFPIHRSMNPVRRSHLRFSAEVVATEASKDDLQVASVDAPSRTKQTAKLASVGILSTPSEMSQMTCDAVQQKASGQQAMSTDADQQSGDSPFLGVRMFTMGARGTHLANDSTRFFCLGWPSRRGIRHWCIDRACGKRCANRTSCVRRCTIVRVRRFAVGLERDERPLIQHTM